MEKAAIYCKNECPCYRLCSKPISDSVTIADDSHDSLVRRNRLCNASFQTLYRGGSRVASRAEQPGWLLANGNASCCVRFISLGAVGARTVGNDASRSLDHDESGRQSHSLSGTAEMALLLATARR